MICTALYQAESVEDAIAPAAGASRGPDHRRRHRRAGADAGGQAGRKGPVSAFTGCDEMRGVTLDEDGEPPHRQPRPPSATSPRDPLIQQYINVLGEAVDMVGGPSDPQHRHHRRQHLQRRYLRRLRLHPPRMGGHRGDHRQKRRAPGTHQGLLPQGRQGGSCGWRRARSRPPS